MENTELVNGLLLFFGMLLGSAVFYILYMWLLKLGATMEAEYTVDTNNVRNSHKYTWVVVRDNPKDVEELLNKVADLLDEEDAKTLRDLINEHLSNSN